MSIKLGFTLSLTGGTDEFGNGARIGAQLALEEYNERGGYKGQKVDAVIYDEETKPEIGVENVRRLITRDGVFALVGPISSGVALAVIDIAQTNGIPLVVPLATAEQVIERYRNAPKNYVFRVSLNDGIQTAIMIDHIKARNYQRIGLMHDRLAGEGCRDAACGCSRSRISVLSPARSIRPAQHRHDAPAHQDEGRQGRFPDRLYARAGRGADHHEHAENRADSAVGGDRGVELAEIP